MAIPSIADVDAGFQRVAAWLKSAVVRYDVPQTLTTTQKATARTSLDVYSKGEVDTGLSGKAPSTHTHAASQISDSTTVGRSLMTATDAAAARAAIGAGTSSLTLGSTSATAAAGDHTHAYVPTSRSVTAGTGLTGGGDLTANRSLAVAYGTTAGTAAQGNDTRLSDARTPTAHTHAASQISDSTTVGRSLMTATNAAAARTAIAASTTVQMTQAAYDALGTKDPTTLYVIVG